MMAEPLGRELMSADDFRLNLGRWRAAKPLLLPVRGTVSRPVFVGQFADAVDRDRDLVDRLLH
jgi:hypothetical protein